MQARAPLMIEHRLIERMIVQIVSGTVKMSQNGRFENAVRFCG